GGSWEYQRDGLYGLVPYVHFGIRSLILWNGWFPFLFSNQVEAKAATGKGTSTESHGSSNGGATKVFSTLTFVRGTLDAEAVIREACTVRNNISWAVEDEESATRNRFCIHHVPPRGGGDDDWSGSS